LIEFSIQSKMKVFRKAPYRKRNTTPPKVVKDFLEEDNISGYPPEVENIQVVCSPTFCSAITASRKVISWGNDYVNQYRQLKVPDTIRNVVQIASCTDYTVALLADGMLVGWGNERKGFYQIPPVKNVKKIAGNGENFLALLGNGELAGWGNSRLFDINGFPKNIYTDSPIVDIAVGYFHAVALKQNGDVVCWGNPVNDHLAVPEIDSKVVQIKSYNEFTLALSENGRISGWGTKRYGQQNIPEELLDSKSSPVISFAVGFYHCAAITKDGHVYTWGWDIRPKDKITQTVILEKEVLDITLNPIEHKYFITPPEEVLTDSNEKPIEIFAGIDITFVLTNEGDLIGWGDDQYELLNVPEIIPPLNRPLQPKIDLSKYGLNIDFDELIQGKYIPSLSQIRPLVSDDLFYIETETKSYKKGKLLGEGGYGKAYEIEYKGKMEAVKIQKIQDESSLANLFLETVIQIIIQNETQRLRPGLKICPDIYEVAYDKKKGNFYIFQEKMDGSLDKQLKEKKFSNRETAEILTQISNKLNFLYDALEFNHRDFKTDNIMFKGNEMVFIDFGLSCLTYRGIRIKSRNYFGKEKCFLETRDMSFLLYDFSTREPKAFTKEMTETLKKMLIFKVKGKTCNLSKEYCDGIEMEWGDYYDMLNLGYIYNPNATTDEVIARMKKFL